MACHSTHFAKSLPCPWVAFGDEILRAAPKGFVHAWVSKLKTHKVADSLRLAHEAIKTTMISSFADELLFSDVAWPSDHFEQGEVTIMHGSPGLFGREETDIASVELDGRLYPEHDPFVGRTVELTTLAKLPSRLSDGQLIQRYWVHGSGGMGKSALLRQHACHVRDLAFADESEPVWLLHAYCMNCVVPKDLETLVLDKATRLYSLPNNPETIQQLFKMLRDVPGVHVWVLDDLTYLCPQLGKEQQSTHTVSTFADAAKVNAIAIQFVVSARLEGTLEWTPLQAKELTRPEAIELANRIRIQDVRRSSDPYHLISDAGMTDAEVHDAGQLFDRCGRSTVHFKRALNYSIQQQISFKEMADQLVGYADGDTEALSQRMVEWELAQLDKLAQRVGFQYRAFLERYWNIIYRAGTFSLDELRLWFPEEFSVPSSTIPLEQAYRRGLVQLVRLGFIATRKESGQEIFYLPPNQRVVMESLASSAEVPSTIPFRAPQANLSMALEHINKGDFESIQTILTIERDYAPYIANVDVATAVVTAALVRAQVEGATDLEKEIAVYDELLGRYGDRDELVLAEKVAQTLFKKGARLAQLDRLTEAIDVYNEVVARYGDRDELVLADQVAKALLNKGYTLGQLDRASDEIHVYSELIERYGDHAELVLTEKVLRALMYKGVTLGQLDRSEEEIAVYDELVTHYGDRPELVLAEQVANALLAKGLTLIQLNRFADAMIVYDQLVERYGARKELSLSEHVAKALLSKGNTLDDLNQLTEAIDVYGELISRYGNSEELIFTQSLAITFLNRAIAFGKLDRLTDAIDDYDELIGRYGDCEDLFFAEQVAIAHLNKGVTLGQLGRSSDEIVVYDELIRRYCGREEPELTVPVAVGFLNKGKTLDQLDCFNGAIDVFDELIRRYGSHEELAFAEQVAKAMLEKSFNLGQLDRFTDEIANYDELIHCFENRHELVLTELVARALLSKGTTLWKLNRCDEAIVVYDDLNTRYGRRDELSLVDWASRANLLKRLVQRSLENPDDNE